jgi:hypothetical protein
MRRAKRKLRMTMRRRMRVIPWWPKYGWNNDLLYAILLDDVSSVY